MKCLVQIGLRYLINKDFIVRNIGLLVLLLVLLFPALEIYTMFQVADIIGWWLLVWLFVSAIIGWALIREESMAIFGRLALAVQNGQSPFVALWQSGRTMLAGVLLIFPGVISDVIALILLAWPSGSVPPDKRNMPDDDIIEGEVRVVEADRIEIKSERH
jgi:UPF0716 protein FxsA